MINFSNYRYIGPHNPDEDESKYAYDDNYYQSLIRDNRYKDAANYLAKYEFTDQKEQEQHLHYIDEIRRNGDIVEAVYSKIQDKQELNSVEFADKVGIAGWYESMRYKMDPSGKVPLYKNDSEFRAANPEAAVVTDYLRNIGSSSLHEATSLSITFNPKKVGLFGWNWSKRNDNGADLDEFYNNGGFTPEMLEAYGVNISKNDKTGETTFTFDKTNVKALNVLAALPERYFAANMVDIHGYYVDDKGNTVKINQRKDELKAGTTNSSDDYFKVTNLQQAHNIRDVINQAKAKRDKIFEKREITDYEVGSTVFDLTTDRTDILKEMHNQGQISDAEYNRRMKDAKDLVGWLRSQTYLNGIYSNVNNEEFTDEHFESIGQEEWFKIKSALGEFNDKDVIIQGQTVNGEIGLRVTLPQAQRKKRLATTEEGGFLHTDKRNIQFFIPASAIPGMLGELQKQIDNRTDLQAIQDFDDMVGYGVRKQLYNGEIISVDDAGNVVREYNGEKMYDDRPDAKNRAIDDLNETRILDKGKYLKFQHMNSNGDINYITYEDDMKKYAIMAANDLIAAPLKDFDGNYLLSRNADRTINYGELFDPTLDLSNYQADVARKILKIREIYDNLMSEIYTYNIR